MAWTTVHCADCPRSELMRYGPGPAPLRCTECRKKHKQIMVKERVRKLRSKPSDKKAMKVKPHIVHIRKSSESAEMFCGAKQDPVILGAWLMRHPGAPWRYCRRCGILFERSEEYGRR